MVFFEKPDDSPRGLEWLTERRELLLQRLGSPSSLLMATREMASSRP